MVELREGWASVPAGVRVVEGENGEPCVTWTGEERGETSEESPLIEFAELSAYSETESAVAVAAFIERHGPLRMCAEHEVEHGSPGHGRCTLLHPEPARLWLDHSADVRRVLAVWESLKAERDPDPYGIRGPKPSGWDPDRQRVEVERLGRELGVPSSELTEFHQEIDRFSEERKAKDKVIEAQGEVIQRYQPTTPAEWWKWIGARVNDGLWSYRPFVHLEIGSGSEGLRPILQTAGLLARVYLALAFEVAGVGSVESCSHCGRFYVPNRAPKKGQRNYCPACRSAHVPQRLHMRERRSE